MSSHLSGTGGLGIGTVKLLETKINEVTSEQDEWIGTVELLETKINEVTSERDGWIGTVELEQDTWRMQNEKYLELESKIELHAKDLVWWQAECAALEDRMSRITNKRDDLSRDASRITKECDGLLRIANEPDDQSRAAVARMLLDIREFDSDLVDRVQTTDAFGMAVHMIKPWLKNFVRDSYHEAKKLGIDVPDLKSDGTFGDYKKS